MSDVGELLADRGLELADVDAEQKFLGAVPAARGFFHIFSGRSTLTAS